MLFCVQQLWCWGKIIALVREGGPARASVQEKTRSAAGEGRQDPCREVAGLWCPKATRACGDVGWMNMRSGLADWVVPTAFC